LSASPSTERFRTIAGSTVWRNASRSLSPPRSRTHLMPFER
jgi:hypothetical protein